MADFILHVENQIELPPVIQGTSKTREILHMNKVRVINNNAHTSYSCVFTQPGPKAAVRSSILKPTLFNNSAPRYPVSTKIKILPLSNI